MGPPGPSLALWGGELGTPSSSFGEAGAERGCLVGAPVPGTAGCHGGGHKGGSVPVGVGGWSEAAAALEMLGITPARSPFLRGGKCVVNRRQHRGPQPDPQPTAMGCLGPEPPPEGERVKISGLAKKTGGGQAQGWRQRCLQPPWVPGSSVTPPAARPPHLVPIGAGGCGAGGGWGDFSRSHPVVMVMG